MTSVQYPVIPDRTYQIVYFVRYLERIPVASTVASVVNITLGILCQCKVIGYIELQNRYYDYICENPLWRHLVLLIPGIGNLIVYLYDRCHPFQEYQLAAEVGDPEAMYKLALLYENGHGVKQDRELAFQLCYDAALSNNVEAANHLGWLYQNGIGTQCNYAKAYNAYFLAVQKGHTIAMINFAYLCGAGLGCVQSDDMCVRWLQMSAQRGEPKAMYCLWMIYNLGSMGEKIDKEKAREWLKKAASAGHSDAIKDLEAKAKELVT